MKKEDNNPLRAKSYAFALRVVKLARFLNEQRKDCIISKQILRSGTSIGANIFEAIYAQTKKDFISKLSISLKETSETIYWLELLKDSDYINEKSYGSMFNDADEIRIMLISSIKTAKRNLKNEEYQ